MIRFSTERLEFLPTPAGAIARRLEAPGDFEHAGALYPADWPGDVLALLPAMARIPEEDCWDGTILESATRAAVGQMGYFFPPDERGVLTVGYGLSPAFRGRGYATEALLGLLAWTRAHTQAAEVRAETLAANAPSARVLAKAGFARTGERPGREGPLVLWSLPL